MSAMGSKSSPAVSNLTRKREPSPESDKSSEPEQTEDVPVLSHAAKRKQKKVPLKEATPAKSPAKKQKKEEDASRPAKRQNSIWVGNLSYKTTPESLRRFFDGVGEITRVHLPTKLGKASPGESAKRENRGCASTATDLFCFVFVDRQPTVLPMWTLRRRGPSRWPLR
jgi:RNA recognition motif-containing protein